MEELYSSAFEILEQTSDNITYRLENVFTYNPKPALTEDQWTEYGDALERLHTERNGEDDALQGIIGNCTIINKLIGRES